MMVDRNSSDTTVANDNNIYGQRNETIDMELIPQEGEKVSQKTNFWQRFHTKQQDKTPTQVFRYATVPELFYIVLGTIASIAFGVCLPLALILFGDFVNSFIDRASHLCSFNFTSLTQHYCPSNITLTSTNFYTAISKFSNSSLIRFASWNTNNKLHEVGLFTAIKQEGNYETGQVCYTNDE
ncbi:unnamed protein product [Rotaria sp. Silwood1]|nr:unnamed protein product [Rotaria sp. Silwood1]